MQKFNCLVQFQDCRTGKWIQKEIQILAENRDKAMIEAQGLACRFRLGEVVASEVARIK